MRIRHLRLARRLDYLSCRLQGGHFPDDEDIGHHTGSNELEFFCSHCQKFLYREPLDEGRNIDLLIALHEAAR